MENNQTTYQPKTKNWWKIATISLIVLAVVLIGTTTLFAVQSGDRQNKLDEVKKQTAQGQEETGESEGDASEGCEKTASSESEPDNRRYLTIKEWGVKFEIPHGLGDVTYEIKERDSGVAIAELKTTLTNNVFIDAIDRTEFMNPIQISKSKDYETTKKWSFDVIKAGDYFYGLNPPQTLYNYDVNSYEDEVNKTKEIVALNLLWSAVHTLTVAN